MNPQLHSRESLATLLWDDRNQKQAMANLRSLLAQLPKEVKPYLEITRHTIGLAAGMPVWVDAAAFVDGVKDGRRSRNQPSALFPLPATPLPVTRMKEVLPLYKGAFLDGVFVRESRGLEEWTAVTRERLQQQAAAAHQQLALHHFYHRNHAAAIGHARALLELDTLREGSHRLLMRLLARDGQINASIQQYEQCRAALGEELGVAPSPETRALHERLLAAKVPIPFVVPTPTTLFVGREAELAQIEARLDRPECRMLTLLGPGGVGKTRLALQTAVSRRGEYLHGIFFVSLAGVDTVEMMFIAMAAALDLPLQGRADAQTMLIHGLRDKELLLILDNFEHLLDVGAPWVQAVLKETEGVQLMITSRERLYLQSEWLLPVDGLPYPEPAQADASDYGAVQLFALRAAQLVPDFDVREAAAVARICRLLEGLPLGIELAAGTLPDYATAQIADNIQKNLDFLATKMRDVPQRHRSLRAVFAHSWELLSAEEQAIFGALAVFRGGFDKAAARAVAGAEPATLRRLETKSLLRQEENGRYAMHETLRHFALETLAERETAVRDRHSQYFGTFISQRQQALEGGEAQLAALAELNVEQSNIEAGWHWTVQQHSVAEIASYVTSWHRWYTLRGFFREGIAALEQAQLPLQTRWHTDKNEAAGRLLAELLAHIGFFRFRLTHFAQARTDLEACLELMQALNMEEAMVKPLGGLANIAMEMGDYAAAERRYQENLELCRRLERLAGAAGNLEGLALVSHAQGDYPASKAYLEQSLSLRRQLGDLHTTANTLGNLGAVETELENFDEAMRLYREALALWQQLGDEHSSVYVLSNMAENALIMADHEKAEQLYMETLQLGERLLQVYGQTVGNQGLGEVALRLSQWATARTHFYAALRVAALGYHQCQAVLGLGLVAAAMKDWGQAARWLALVVESDATLQGDRERAEAKLEELTAVLSPVEMQAAREFAAAQEWESAVAAILATA